MTPAFEQLTGLIDELGSGQVRLLSAENVDDALSTLAAVGDSLTDGTRVLLRLWERLPSNRDLIDEMLECLSRLALGLWPDWYSAAAEPSDLYPGLAHAELLRRARSLGIRGEVSETWLRRAAGSCFSGEPPQFKELSSAFEARQLSLVIAPLHCVLALACGAGPQPAGALFGLARTAEWLAAETKAAVLVIVPSTIESPELDSISFGRMALAPAAMDAPSAIDERDSESGGAGEAHVGACEWLAPPLIGRPHPNSRGEQLLWAAIQSDRFLKGLFLCNQPLRTEFGTRCIGDLVASAIGLVVEVDGYHWHSSREAFARDRQRDFELMMSGYRVLRLPHDAVVADIAEAVGKVRAAAQYRLAAGAIRQDATSEIAIRT